MSAAFRRRDLRLTVTFRPYGSDAPLPVVDATVEYLYLQALRDTPLELLVQTPGGILAVRIKGPVPVTGPVRP